MIITIDGYDGTGKTTLAKNIANKYGFFYLDKPVIKMTQCQKNISRNDATKLVENVEHELFSNTLNNRKKIAKYYCNTLLWLSAYKNDIDIILDRGLLTTYAIVGDSETESIFDQYISSGAFLDGSIYLTATDDERIRRIYTNDPNDPDLKFPPKWRENNLEEYATSRNLNYYKINTDCKTPQEVFKQATIFLDNQIEKQNNKFDYER